MMMMKMRVMVVMAMPVAPVLLKWGPFDADSSGDR